MIPAGFFRLSGKTRFGSNFLAVAKANLVALVLPILVLPVVTRLFKPDDFGALAVFTATAAIVMAVSTWRFDWVVPNAKSKGVAASLFVAGIVVLIGTITSILLGLLVTNPANVPWASFRQLGWMVYLIPLSLLGTGIHALLTGWFVRQGDLSAVSRATIFKSASNVSVQLATGAFGLGSVGLVSAYVIAAWFGNGAMLRLAGQDLVASMRRVRVRTVRAAFSRYGRTATWSTAVSLLNALSLNATVLLLAFFFAPKEVGWYALMYRLVAAPVGAMTSALGQSFWSEAADLARAGRHEALSKLYRRTTMQLGLAGLPVIGGCLVAPFVVGPILGQDEWGGAGFVLLAMAPLFMGSIMFSPTNHLVVFDKQHWQLIVDFARLVLTIIAIVVAYRWGLGIAATVAMASGASFLGHALLYLIHIKIHIEVHKKHGH